MPRDNHLNRSRSRSLSRYRNYNSNTKLQQSSYRYNSRNDLSPPIKRSRYQRERSRSYEKNGRSHHRRSSPPSAAVTTDISRKNHEPSKVLGVFNLHVRTTESEIRDVFERFGQIDEIIMVKDAKTRGFRGYCFLYFNRQRDATEALNSCNGIEIKDRQIRVDYSLSEGPHSSTPGEYRGRRGRTSSMRGQRPRHYSPARGDRTRYYDRHDSDRPRRPRSLDRVERRTPPRDIDRSDYRERPRRSSERFERYSRRSPPRERRDRH